MLKFNWKLVAAQSLAILCIRQTKIESAKKKSEQEIQQLNEKKLLARKKYDEAAHKSTAISHAM